MTERELLDRLARDVRDLVAHGEGILGVARAMCALDATPDDLISQRDEARRAKEDAMADALHAHSARQAAEATVRELRALCGEAATVLLSDTVWCSDAPGERAWALHRRLEAAAVQPASEGRALDGESDR